MNAYVQASGNLGVCEAYRGHLEYLLLPGRKPTGLRLRAHSAVPRHIGISHARMLGNTSRSVPR